MKSLLFIGIILLAISGLLFYYTTDFVLEKFGSAHIMGILGGIGIGLIIGGIVGYISKGSSVRQNAKRRELEQLRKEKAALQKQKNDLESENSNKPYNGL